MAVYDVLSAESFLEYAFLRWILAPATKPEIVGRVKPQYEVTWAGHTYRIDYAIVGQNRFIAVELDGFTFHGSRSAFSYDRLRQNDLHAAGWLVVRFYQCRLRHVRRRGKNGARGRHLPGLYQTQSDGDYSGERHSRDF